MNFYNQPAISKIKGTNILALCSDRVHKNT